MSLEHRRSHRLVQGLVGLGNKPFGVPVKTGRDALQKLIKTRPKVGLSDLRCTSWSSSSGSLASDRSSSFGGGDPFS